MKNFFNKHIFAIALMAVMLAGCEKAERPDEKGSGEFKKMDNVEFTKAEEGISLSINDFGVNLFNGVAGGNVLTEDYVVSPLSTSIALAMTSNGAKAQTFSQISNVLGFKDLQKSDINNYYCKILNTLARKDDFCSVLVSNSAWISEMYPVKESFKDSLSVNYGAETANVDFTSASAVDRINAWVKSNSGGMIDKMFDSISDNTALVLINALFYSGKWSFEFNGDDVESVFHSPAGDYNCKMLNVSRMFYYFEDTDFQVLELGYANGLQSLDIFLPKTNVKGLTSKYVFDAIENLRPQMVSLMMPSFEISSSLDLKNTLGAMGIVDAFDSDKADFSDIANDIFVSSVQHNARIQVTKDGTVAGAATDIAFTETSVGPGVVDPVNFTADHPFYFILRDKGSDAMLFIGQKAK